MNLRGLGLQMDAMAHGERRGRTGPGDESSGAVFTLPDAGPQQPRHGAERAPAQDRRAAQDSETRRDAAADRASRDEMRREDDAGRRRAEGERELEHEGAASPTTTARRERAQHDGEHDDAARETASPDQRASAAEPSRGAAVLMQEAGPEPASTASPETTRQNPESFAADNVLAQIGLPQLLAANGRAPTEQAPVDGGATATMPAIASTPAIAPGAIGATSMPMRVVPATTSMPSSVAQSAIAPAAVPLSSPGQTPATVLPHAAPMQTATTHPKVDAGTPSATALSGATTASMPVEGFAALAALAGSLNSDGAPEGALETRSLDAALPKTDAFALSSLNSTLPASPVRLAEQSANVPSLGSIALPPTPDAGFDDSFDQRIAWMADQRITQAEMRVSPEGVGPIEVRLQIEGHRVTAQFNAANADVRQALEAGMERLRDLLGQRGMELADAQVGRQGAQRDHGSHHAGGGNGLTEIAEGSTTTVGPLLRSRGLIDEYV